MEKNESEEWKVMWEMNNQSIQQYLFCTHNKGAATESKTQVWKGVIGYDVIAVTQHCDRLKAS